MRTKKILLILILVSAIFFLSLFLYENFLRSKNAGLYIETTPPASVFINGEQKGKTPYNGDFPPGEIELKLVPDSFEKPLTFYETRVSLVGGIKTIVRRTFGDSKETSGGELISFEKVSKNEASLVIIANPDGSSIKIDGETKGVSPLKITSITPGTHELSVSAPGYLDRSFSVQIVKGYSLTPIVDLITSGQPVVLNTTDATGNKEASSEAKISKEEEIEILKTPTNFLRVRKEPTITSDEIARVTPGEKFKLIEKDPKNGWYKILVKEDLSGWISNEYATASAKESN